MLNAQTLAELLKAAANYQPRVDGDKVVLQTTGGEIVFHSIANGSCLAYFNDTAD